VPSFNLKGLKQASLLAIGAMATRVTVRAQAV